jgi:hypothetical protein
MPRQSRHIGSDLTFRGWTAWHERSKHRLWVVVLKFAVIVANMIFVVSTVTENQAVGPGEVENSTMSPFPTNTRGENCEFVRAGL